ALGESALSEKQLDKTFEVWWPDLESSVQNIQSVKEAYRPQRGEREILEEILALVRDQAKRTTSEQPYLGQPYVIGSEPYIVGPDRQIRIIGSGVGKTWRYLTDVPANLTFVDPKAGQVVGGENKAAAEAKSKDSDEEPKGQSRGSGKQAPPGRKKD